MKGEDKMDNKMGNYCGKCGAKLTDGVCLQCAAANTALVKDQEDKYHGFFRSADEKLIAILGKVYFNNYINKGILMKGFAVLSDKRVYLKGEYYNAIERKNGTRNYQKVSQEKTFDLRDIIGVGFENPTQHVWLLLSILIAILCIPVAYILALLLLYFCYTINISEGNMDDFLKIFIVFLFLGALFWLYSIGKSIKERRKYITIQYAGGIVAFPQEWYSDSDMEQFKNLVHTAKDSVISENSKAVATKIESVSTQKASLADEISKLNELLAQGTLSQEEFDKAKKELLGL